jgi:enamine deaminase RidA (YjgF/YER057c/UK114 family)
MRLDSLLYARQSCITCSDPAPCNCAANQDCFLINRLLPISPSFLFCVLIIPLFRDCTHCATFKCVPSGSAGGNPPKGHVLSPGALAGAVIGTVVVVVIAVFIFIWYRRRSLRALNEPTLKNDIPASAETVLNRPDPVEKHLSTYRESPAEDISTASQTAADPDSRAPSTPLSNKIDEVAQLLHRNPFADEHSIQTVGTEGTDVVPIALVAPANSVLSDDGSPPSRPPRSPELNLNLDHVNVSRDSLKTGAPSTRSGVSAASSRMSFMSGATEFLKEAPMIVTPGKAAVRQVLGVVKAEVIQAPPSTGSSISLKPGPSLSRPSIGSPLAAHSFGPADLVQQSPKITIPTNPFSDEHSARAVGISPSSVTTFGILSPGVPPPSAATASWGSEEPRMPWVDATESRPTSISSQTGTIVADIGSATRVYVGPMSAGQSAGSPYRTAMGKLVNASATRLQGTLEEQQRLALAHAQAQAKAQGLAVKRRVSSTSVLSAASASSASTRADSILEAFPFVPPSPISDRPLRAPPVSPLSQHEASEPTDSKQKTLSSQTSPTEPPSRRALGLSTGSQLSTASAGLGSFPFQIETVNTADLISEPPSSSSASSGRQRASLDTLAITKELSSYPLPFDPDVRDSFGIVKN